MSSLSHILHRDCWIWTRAKTVDGYPNNQMCRKIYETVVGSVPLGWHLHHACKIKACRNPWHGVPLTPLEHRKMHGFDCQDPTHHRIIWGSHRYCHDCQKKRNREHKAAKKLLMKKGR